MKSCFPLFLFLLLPLHVAKAATYYVDSSFGNDKWSGNQSTPVGSPAADGPWQSLAKMSGYAFLPGDSVLLKCGGIWYETLTLKSSGTASSPITIGAYPNACTNKPIINGAMPIPAHNWIKDTGNIYKLSSTINLINYGTFENGLGTWGKSSAMNDVTMSLSNSCPQSNNTCMAYVSGTGGGSISSNNFTLMGKRSYTASFSFKAPAGVKVWVIVRQGVAPWNVVGLASQVTGIGNWQTITLPFIATTSQQYARLDFDVPAGQTMGLDDVNITTSLNNVDGVFDNGKSINIAHYPNRGYNPLKPETLFLATASDADNVSRTYGSGSTYLTAGSDLSASTLASITPGTGIRIRTNAWDISDRKIASVSGSRLNLDSLSDFPIKQNWGYYLYGQRWMLDEPGEWHFDTSTKTLSVWMADNTTPGSRITIGQQGVGINVNTLSNLRIDGLSIRNVGTGVLMNGSTNVILNNMYIADTLGMGVSAISSTDSGVEASEIIRTAGDAISVDGVATRFHAYDNLVQNSSVQTTNNIVTSLPVHARTAIDTGNNATIRGNRIYDAAYVGIWGYANNLISGNHIENACRVLDDCGAIGTSAQNNNSIIENNTILHVPGGLPGKPADSISEAQGIYLDNFSSGITIRGNTIVDAHDGIELHNATNNIIENNTLYGNRLFQMRLHEDSKTLNSLGDLYGNSVHGNRFFPPLFSASAGTAVSQITGLQKTNTERFANFDSNLYFTLLSPAMASETWPGGMAAYTLPKWKTAVNASNVPRNLDPTANEVSGSSIKYTALHVLGSNIVPNGKFSSGLTGWVSWNETAPYGQLILEPYTAASGAVRYLAGSTLSLLHSPNFSITQGQSYRISFDLKTSVDLLPVSIVTRRGGGGLNGYEGLTDTYIQFIGSANWQRYSFVFKAIKTVKANDPVTLDLGARVDFEHINPGQGISVANLEIVPFSLVDASLRSHILVNSGAGAGQVDCPDGTNALFCSEYVRFTDGQSIIWPYPLPPHGSEIIYSRDSSLTDTDGDGILDSQDSCNGTGASLAVNAAGCSLAQQ